MLAVLGVASWPGSPGATTRACCWPPRWRRFWSPCARSSTPLLVTLELPTLADVADVGLGLLVLGCLVWAPRRGSPGAGTIVRGRSGAEAGLFRRVVDVTAFVVFAAGLTGVDRARRRRQLGLPGHVSRLQWPGRPAVRPRSAGRYPALPPPAGVRRAGAGGCGSPSRRSAPSAASRRRPSQPGAARQHARCRAPSAPRRSRPATRRSCRPCTSPAPPRPGPPPSSWRCLRTALTVAPPEGRSRRRASAARSAGEGRLARMLSALCPADQAPGHVAAAGDDGHGHGHRRARHADARHLRWPRCSAAR